VIDDKTQIQRHDSDNFCWVKKLRKILFRVCLKIIQMVGSVTKVGYPHTHAYVSASNTVTKLNY